MPKAEQPDDHVEDRRAELIAGAVRGDLTPRESAEFDALRAADPLVDVETAELQDVALKMASWGSWQSADASDDLRARIAAIGTDDEGTALIGTDDERAPTPHLPVVTLASRRRPVLLGLGAAASLAVGLGLGLGVPAMQSAPPTGPAGTLGAIEAVDFTGEPAGARVDGELIAHTWGIESVLEIDGVAPGESFSVIVVGTDGAEYDSGTFLGSEVVIHCRMNAAVLRAQVASVEVRTAAGETIAAAEVPGLDR